VSRYQKKHSPTHTHRGHQSSLSAFSIYYEPWHRPQTSVNEITTQLWNYGWLCTEIANRLAHLIPMKIINIVSCNKFSMPWPGQFLGLTSVSWGRPLMVGIAQLAHAGGESIFCCEVWRCSSSLKTLGWLVKDEGFLTVPMTTPRK